MTNLVNLTFNLYLAHTQRRMYQLSKRELSDAAEREYLLS